MFHVEQRGQWVRVWRGRDGGGWLCRTLLESTDLQAMQQGVGVSESYPRRGRLWGVRWRVGAFLRLSRRRSVCCPKLLG